MNVYMHIHISYLLFNLCNSLKEIGDPLKRQIKYIVVTVFLMDVMVDMKQEMNHVEMVIMDHYVDHVNTVIF